jgi:hypothetical protein
MREFVQYFADGLKRGLRREAISDRQTQALVRCRNAKPKEHGLEAHTAISDPFSGQTVSWPFPQLIRGRELTLLAAATSLSEVDETTTPWSTSAVTVYDYINQETADSITTGGQWHMADFGDTFYLFNGNCTVFRLNLADMLMAGTNKTLVQEDITIQTGCDFRGRLIIGGFNPSDFWGDSWTDLLGQWASGQPDPVNRTYNHLLDTATNMGDNFVQWSTIGGGDTFFWFWPDLAVTGPIGRTVAHDYDPVNHPRPSIFDYLERNEMGFMPMPFQGSVLCVKPLGRTVMAYGEDGVAALPMVSEPFPTFGCVPLLNTGVADRGAVGGDDREHIMVDQEGEVWRISADLNVQRAGYKEFTSALLDGEPIISLDESEREYYIASGSGSGAVGGYVLTAQGLGECVELPTSLARNEDGLVGLFEDGDIGDHLIVITDTFDLGNRGMKCITGIEVGVETGQDTDVAVYYRNSKADAFSLRSGVILNREGWAIVSITGVEFRVVVDIDSYISAELDYITVRWRQLDKRGIRGAYVAQAQPEPGF